MSRLHINYTLVLVLLLVWAMTLLMVASPYEICETSATRTVHIPVDASPSGGQPNNAPSHCLIYGKDCLGESLHGR
jgi:hypothetical protein